MHRLVVSRLPGSGVLSASQQRVLHTGPSEEGLLKKGMVPGFLPWEAGFGSLAFPQRGSNCNFLQGMGATTQPPSAARGCLLTLPILRRAPQEEAQGLRVRWLMSRTRRHRCLCPDAA